MVSKAELSLSQEDRGDKFVSKLSPGSCSYLHFDIKAEDTKPGSSFCFAPDTLCCNVG